MNTMPPIPSPIDKSSPSTFGPGSVMGIVLKKLGYGNMTPDCGCAAFARKMNDWGWLGCLTTHRQEIINWFALKAKEQGVQVDGKNIWSLLQAGIKDIGQRRAMQETEPSAPASPERRASTLFHPPTPSIHLASRTLAFTEFSFRYRAVARTGHHLINRGPMRRNLWSPVSRPRMRRRANLPIGNRLAPASHLLLPPRPARHHGDGWTTEQHPLMMANEIYVDPVITDPVIQVGGVCYYRDEPAERPPNTFSKDIQNTSCECCWIKPKSCKTNGESPVWVVPCPATSGDIIIQIASAHCYYVNRNFAQYETVPAGYTATGYSKYSGSCAACNAAAGNCPWAYVISSSPVSCGCRSGAFASSLYAGTSADKLFLASKSYVKAGIASDYWWSAYVYDGNTSCSSSPTYEDFNGARVSCASHIGGGIYRISSIDFTGYGWDGPFVGTQDVLVGTNNFTQTLACTHGHVWAGSQMTALAVW